MRIHLIGAALAVAVLAAPAAYAQGIDFGPGGVRIDRGDRYDQQWDGGDEVSRREAIHIARDEGLRDLDDVFRRGWRWVVLGNDRRGDDMRVTIDARDGSVLNVDRY